MSRAKFSVHGWLDSNAVGRGRSLDSMVASALARNHNTALQNREPVFTCAFDARNDGSFVGSDYPGAMSIRDERGGIWAPVGWPIPLAKRPHCRSIEVHWYALSDGHEAWVGAGSIADPFIGRSDQRTLITTAATATYYTSVINVSPGPREVISLHWRSAQPTSAASGYGKQNGSIGSGTGFAVNRRTLIWEDGALDASPWAASPSVAASATYAGRYLALMDGNGNPLVSPRRIEAVLQMPADWLSLMFTPEITSEEAQLLNEGGTWAIYSPGAIRIYSVSGYESLVYGT